MFEKTELLIKISEILCSLSEEDVSRLLEYVEALKAQHNQ